ncbi:hypothetical protein GUJ93_ZPchr0007g5138 [Zizania palustris]|uniref:Secreted protein n=1 Tax=Zizania palustris TaxID=103762 RepID=A0A8J5SRS2_ZIZPA|nr:hypothetical protein GUJ93_ZPchr0007g5138 [Zizania palustris]
MTDDILPSSNWIAQKCLLCHVLLVVGTWIASESCLPGQPVGSKGIQLVVDAKQKRKKGIFTKQGGDKEYASLSALRRLPLDLGNPTFLHRAVQRV